MNLKPQLALLLLLAAPAHAAERVFEFVPHAAYHIEFVNGQQIAISDGVSAVVALSFVPAEKRGKGWIVVNVKNLSPESFVVRESSLRASSGDQPLHVATYDDLLKHQKRKEFWNTFGAGLAAGINDMNAANAGYSYNSGTYSSTTDATAYGSGGYAHGTAQTTGSYSGVTYDSGVAYAAQAHADEQNARMLAQVEQNNAQERATLESRALRANTLRAGEFTSGMVLIDLPKKSRKRPAILELTLTAGMDEFRFLLQESN